MNSGFGNIYLAAFAARQILSHYSPRIIVNCLSPQNFAQALFWVSLGVILTPHEKLKTMLMQIFGVTKKSIMVCYSIFWSGQFHNSPHDTLRTVSNLLCTKAVNPLWDTNTTLFKKAALQNGLKLRPHETGYIKKSLKMSGFDKNFPWSVLLSTILRKPKYVQNSSGTTSRRRVLSLQSFEHFDVIFMACKRTDHGKLLSICFFFYNTIESFRFEDENEYKYEI